MMGGFAVARCGMAWCSHTWYCCYDMLTTVCYCTQCVGLIGLALGGMNWSVDGYPVIKFLNVIFSILTLTVLPFAGIYY